MPWKENTPMSERLYMCKLAADGTYTVAQLARDFGVSRRVVYKWLERYEAFGIEGIFDRSRRPKSSPHSTDDQIVEAVLALKNKYPMWGPRKLQTLLQKDLGEAAPSKSTVGRILDRHGLVERVVPNAMQEATGRFERDSANDLWQTDFTSPVTLPSGMKMWPVPMLDDRSRYCVSLLAAGDCSSESALCCFRAAASKNGLPEEILSDHGSAFGTSREYVSAFTAYMWAVGVKHIQGRYAHPQTQGKLERFNRTLQREWINNHSYTSLDDWNKSFEEYRHLYNEVRPHESLGDKVPASCYNPSQKPFEEPDKHYRENGEAYIHRKVDVSGRIWILSHQVRVGSGLAGWTVSAIHEGSGIWTVYFRGHKLCQASLAKLAPHKPRP